MLFYDKTPFYSYFSVEEFLFQSNDVFSTETGLELDGIAGPVR